MTLLVPALLGLLAVLPLIYLAHLLRGSRRRQRVSATLLWRDLPPEQADRRRMRPPPLGLFLLLQFAATVVAVLAMARLATPGEPRRHLAIVLDASASMQATDVAPNRFESARGRALQRLDALGSDDSATLVRAGPRATLLASGLPAHGRDALERAEPGAGAAEYAEALALASAQIGATPDATGEILLVTDGAFAPIQPPGVLAAAVEIDLVGGGGGNQAIVNLQVRAEPNSASQTAQIEVANAEPRAVRVRVRVLADDLLLDTITLDLPARSREMLFVSVPAETSRVTAQLEGRDALALDDIAEVGTRSLRARQVVLVSYVPAPLQRALQAIPFVRLTVFSPSDYEALAVPAELTVLDGVIPERMPGGPLFLVNPPDQSTFLSVGGEFGAGPVTLFDARHPLLQGVDAAAFSGGWSAQITAPEWARVVAASAQGPLLLDGQRDGRPVIVLAPDPLLSGLDKSIAFPVLVSNAVSYLLGGVGPNVAPGQVLALPVPSGDTLVLRRPDGRLEALQSGPSEVRVDRTEQIGRYAVLGQRSGELVRSFSVTLQDAAESDIAPRAPEPLAAGLVHSTPQAHAEWWWPLAFGAFLLLGVEWLAYARYG